MFSLICNVKEIYMFESEHCCIADVNVLAASTNHILISIVTDTNISPKTGHLLHWSVQTDTDHSVNK